MTKDLVPMAARMALFARETVGGAGLRKMGDADRWKR